MDLVGLVLVLVVVGVLVYALTTLLPMPPQWAHAIQVLALIVLLLYLVTRFLRVPDLLPLVFYS